MKTTERLVLDLLGALEFLPLYEGTGEHVVVVGVHVVRGIRRAENRLRRRLGMCRHKPVKSLPLRTPESILEGLK